ncbi:hypothetical protein ABMA27_011119 [Loxostege sticticalis]|uniref:Uncharacterized protein n=1 Tax=Loxostege sticticalis TaxID=481309 RepID=A0ABR3H3I8_LOXSC
MEGGEGMVAVVRGLRDSGLAVTLLDGTRQYTLVPNAVQPVQPPPPTNVHITQQSASAAQTAEPEPLRSDSAAQATDGRYASMYKMAHCRVAPTSPPVQLTEFPPQRAELCRGQGNFEVGGSGSGENYTPCRSSGSFRGAMSWPDRGSVCSPRPSREPDAFANSLRKYPSVSVERSTEMVERLITYTQAKNNRNASRNTVPRTSYQKNYEPEVTISSKARPRVEESPTRDLRVTRAENKYLKDITRRVKENIRGLSCYVAVPLSPTSSSDDQKPEGDVSDQRQAKLNSNTRTYKSANMPVNYSVQATSSSINKEKLIPNCHRMVIQRKIKSEEIVHKDFGDEMFDLLEKVSVCPNTDPRAYDLRLEVLKQMSIKLQKMTEEINWNERNENTKEQIGKLLKFVPLWIPSGDIQAYREAISDEIMSRMSRYRSFNVYRTETHSNISNEERNLDDILRNWIRNVPFKSFDIFGKPIVKDNIVATFLNRLKRLIQNRPENDSSYLLKLEMVNIISKLPIPANDLIKSDYLNDLAESLLMKLRSKQYLKHCGDKFDSESDPANQNRIFRRYIQPTEKEVRDCISDELKLFLETCSRTNSVDLKDIEIEIIDYIIDSIQAIRSATDRCVESELIMLLCQEIENITWYDARKFVQKLLVLVKNMFSSDTTNQDVEQSVSNQTQSYVVLQNTSNSYPHHKTNTNEDFHNSSDFSIGAISKADIDANLDAYMDQLTSQIDQWLASLPMQIPQAHDSGFRQVVVHDLAGDILDRHKYLELNPSSRGSDADQLEHLKYQIFKWINKLVGEDNMNTIEHAPALMQRIQSIPVPMLAIPQQNITAGSSYPPNGPNVNSMPGENNINTSQIQPMPVNKSRLSISQAQPKNDQSSPSMKKLNEEYDVFVKKWVQEIPIPTSTPEEKALADKARMGIYNGVWKAITKLKFEPATFDNPFYYEDALDDELEELLSALPKTSELETKKHLLKVQLIEKTTNTSDLIKSTATPSSYRQQLVENVSNSLPHKTADNEDPKQALEQVQILRLVEDFILFANYKEIDKAKANVYRKKLIQEAQILVDNLKKTHGKELQDIDTDVYINSIFNVLHKVPLPKEETIKDEADEIMLGAEVENWLSDLPVVPNNDGNEQMQRKKLKDALVKRIREIEKDVNILDRAGERVLKHEISSFLEKVPMQQGENVNITFMADEFANRLKNRAQQQQSAKSILQKCIGEPCPSANDPRYEPIRSRTKT